VQQQHAVHDTVQQQHAVHDTMQQQHAVHAKHLGSHYPAVTLTGTNFTVGYTGCPSDSVMMASNPSFDRLRACAYQKSRYKASHERLQCWVLV